MAHDSARILKASVQVPEWWIGVGGNKKTISNAKMLHNAGYLKRQEPMLVKTTCR